MMTPSIGRIVIFHDYNDAAKVAVDVPAIILGVHPSPGPGTPLMVGLGIFSSVGYGYIGGAIEGAEVGKWSWPERIESGDVLRALGAI